MMAAMMLPGAAPAVLRRACAAVVRAGPLCGASYLAVWRLAGVVVSAAYRRQGSLVAGVVVIAAGLYELTPFKQRFRRRCRESVRTGFHYGLDCVGSSIGLMAMLVALSVMSVAWMLLIALAVFAQNLLPSQATLDVSLALALVGFRIVILVAPSSVPGLM